MTSIQLNAQNVQLWQNIGLIADSERLMSRLAKYVSKLAKEKAEDDSLMSKEEFFARVDEAREEIKDGKGHSYASVEELDKFLSTL